MSNVMSHVMSNVMPLTVGSLVEFVAAQEEPEGSISLRWLSDAVAATGSEPRHAYASRSVLDALQGDIMALSAVNVAAYLAAHPGAAGRPVPWWVAGASSDVGEEMTIGSAFTEFTFVYDYALPCDGELALYLDWAQQMGNLALAVDWSYAHRHPAGPDASAAELALHAHREVMQRGLLRRLALVQRFFVAQMTSEDPHGELRWTPRFIAVLESEGLSTATLSPAAAWLWWPDFDGVLWGAVVADPER
eukprot:3205125-Rhodomonas_salina.1